MNKSSIRAACFGFPCPEHEGCYLQYLRQQTVTWLFRLVAISSLSSLAVVIREPELLSDQCAWLPLASNTLQIFLWLGLQLHRRIGRLATVCLLGLLFRSYYILALFKLVPWTALAHKVVTRGRSTGVA
jgi:hypothetical protein